MRDSKHRQQTGFTIIELLVATLVFSIVLIVVLSAIVQISRLFYKGVNMNSAQENARTIIQDVSDDLKFSQGGVVWPSSSQFCIGTHRYLLQKGQQVGSGPGIYGLQRDTIGSSGCPTPALLAGTNKEQLLDNGMQLNALNLTCGQFGSCNLNLHIVFYGSAGSSAEKDAYFSSPSGKTPTNTAPDAECTGSLQSSQFCATADFDSTIIQGI